MSRLTPPLQALTDLDVSGCCGAGDAFLLQLLGGRFWDVRDCLPLQRGSTAAHAHGSQAASLGAGGAASLGVGGAVFLDACAAAALHGQSEARQFLLLEQALQVPAGRIQTQTSVC